MSETNTPINQSKISSQPELFSTKEDLTPSNSQENNIDKLTFENTEKIPDQPRSSGRSRMAASG